MSQTAHQETFTGQTVRQALKDWDSLKALGQHALSHRRVVKERQRSAGYTASLTGQGLALREVLAQAIEQLKPAEDSPDPAQKKWRSYVILTEQFANGRTPDWVAAQLHISRGTYFSEQQRALERLADILQKWEDAAPAGETPVRLAPPVFPSSLIPPRPAQPLVGHQQNLAQIKKALLTGGNGVAVALNGLPGVGKTTLAIELAHDPEIIAHFADGILWMGLGRQPDLPALLGIWGAAVGLPAEAIANYPGLTERAAAIRAAIGSRRMLLIIDDAWQVESALAFKVGGPNCAYVFTSRLTNVALDLAGERVIKINELDLPRGLDLLAHFTPTLIETAPDEAVKLVRSAGGLPLALILMGGYLRKQSYNAQTRRVHQALTQLETAAARLRLSRPQSPVEAHPDVPYGTPLSLQTIIGLNEAFLTPAARQALRDLALFDPKPNTFSEKAALAVIDGSGVERDQLVDHGLLESVAPERYTIHQTIADYAALEGRDSAAVGRFVAYFVGYLERKAADFAALDNALTNLVTALDLAGEVDLGPQLVRGVEAIFPFLETRGLYQLAERLLNRSAQIMVSADNQVGLAQNWFHLGKLSVNRGNFKDAKIKLQKSIDLARQLGLKQIEADGLFQLGLSGWYAAQNTAESTAMIERSLELYRQLPNCREMEGYALNGVGFTCQEWGYYDRAIDYLEQALNLGHDCVYHRVEGWAHLNLGLVWLPIGDFQRAKTHFLECLRLYRQIGDRRGEGWLIYNLGRYYRKVGDYRQARASLEQALEILTGIGDRFGQGFATHNLGQIFSELGQDQRAITHFEQALSIFQEMDCRTGWSQTCHSLGLRLRQLGDDAAALPHFEQALAMRRQISYTRGEAMTMINLGLISQNQGDDRAAANYSRQAVTIARDLGAKPTLAYILNLSGHILTGQGCRAEAGKPINRRRRCGAG